MMPFPRTCYHTKLQAEGFRRETGRLLHAMFLAGLLLGRFVLRGLIGVVRAIVGVAAILIMGVVFG